MTIQITGKNACLFGFRPDTGKWFERYYPTVEAAEKYARKRGWPVAVATI